MIGANGGAVELEQAPALEDAVDDGFGQVVVMQHRAPALPGASTACGPAVRQRQAKQ